MEFYLLASCFTWFKLFHLLEGNSLCLRRKPHYIRNTICLMVYPNTGHCHSYKCIFSFAVYCLEKKVRGCIVSKHRFMITICIYKPPVDAWNRIVLHLFGIFFHIHTYLWWSLIYKLSIIITNSKVVKL